MRRTRNIKTETSKTNEIKFITYIQMPFPLHNYINIRQKFDLNLTIIKFVDKKSLKSHTIRYLEIKLIQSVRLVLNEN